MYQIKWHDQRNATEDYSSTWKRISTDKVREMIKRRVGHDGLGRVLHDIALGQQWSEKTLSIRCAPEHIASARERTDSHLKTKTTMPSLKASCFIHVAPMAVEFSNSECNEIIDHFKRIRPLYGTVVDAEIDTYHDRTEAAQTGEN